MKYNCFLLLLLTLLLAPSVSAASSVGVTINGQPVPFDDSYGRPFIDQAGRTQVPFRLTMETFGCAVSWDGDTRTAIASKDGVTVRVPIGQPCIETNGTQTPMDTTAVIINERTYLPIRAVLEAFGAQVTWNAETRQVTVTTGDAPSFFLMVHFMDVGQGDAAIIDCGPFEVLIDGGSPQAGPDVVDCLSNYVDGPLDYIIATHPDADHIGGLADVLAAYQVREIIDSGFVKDTKAYETYWNAALTEPDCTISYDDNRMIGLGPGTYLSIIETGDRWPDANSSSIVAQLVCEDLTVLFTGDMTQEVEHTNIPLFGDVDVLKVAHHGSRTSTSLEFLNRVKPEYAVISYGLGNSYGHPSPDALSRLFAVGTTVYSTGKSSPLLLISDGQTWQFSPAQPLTMADAGS